MALVVPLVWTLATTPPFAVRPAAYSSSGLLGPDSPAFADVNGNGQRDPDDIQFWPRRLDTRVITGWSGSRLGLNQNPFDCDPGNGNELVHLYDRNGDGKFDTTVHQNGNRAVLLEFTKFDDGSPFAGRITPYFDGYRVGWGSAWLVDANHDRVYEGWKAEGLVAGRFRIEKVRISMDFVTLDVNDDGFPDYISIPWALSDVIGVRAEPLCGQPLSQVWLPLTKDYRIGFDLDANGEPDPDFFLSPRLDGAPPLPPPPPPPLGCTRTVDYWRTHLDEATPLLPLGLGTIGNSKTVVVYSTQIANTILSGGGSHGVHAAWAGINYVYAQLLAAKLNIANGAHAATVAPTIAAVDFFFSTRNALDWLLMPPSQQAIVLAWGATLEQFNNGLLGPPPCS
jgi:hypothetical protein